MANVAEYIGTQIESIALALVTMDGEDIPALGEILNQLARIKDQSPAMGSDTFVALAGALEGYLEKVVLRETCDLAPFENGLEHLQRCFHSLCNGVEDTEDLPSVLAQLGFARDGQDGDGDRQQTEDSAASQQTGNVEDVTADRPEPEEDMEHFGSPVNPDEEDREIISGFVMESLENLETVEFSLMDMEENPDDPESINAIFRSFHTIKGVSAFLGFMRINRLAHRSENLLDKIRSGELGIRPEIVDVILDSVDLLKQLIQGVKTGLDSGSGMDIGLQIAPLISRIEAALNEDNDHRPIGRIMLDQGALQEDDLNQALARQKAGSDQKLGEILVEAGKATSRQVVSALRDQKKGLVQRTGLQVKVDTKKLDTLVDMTGELVIAQSILRQHPHIAASQDQSLVHTLGQLSQITSTLQAMTMSLRMVPIKSTFQKMVRLVRDLARNCRTWSGAPACRNCGPGPGPGAPFFERCF